MDLFVLRHGTAEPSSPGGDDSGRKLTGKGKDEIRHLAGWMAEQGLSFDVIATSPLPRAHETAVIVAKELGNESRVASWKSLGPGGDIDKVLKDAAKSGRDSRVLIVGHEPALSMLISRIISGSDDISVVLGKGSLAKIRNYSVVNDVAVGELQWLVSPKLVGTRK